MTQPMNMGQMLGVLVSLKELQERKLSREQQATQFAQSLGVEKAAQVMRFLDKIENSPQQAQSALRGLANTLGWEEGQVQQLVEYSQSMPETSAQLRERLVREGYMNMSPGQQGQVAREAAYGALAGQSQGGAAQSGVQAWLASGGDPQSLDQLWSDQFRQSLQQGYVTQQARPMSGAMEQAAIEGGLVNRAAGIQFGGDLTAAQQGSLEMQGANLTQRKLEFTAQQEAIGNASRQAVDAGLDPSQFINALSEMRMTAAQAVNPEMSKPARDFAWRRYNSLARMLGQPDLAVTNSNKASEAPGLLEQYMNKYKFDQLMGGAMAPAPVTSMPPLPGFSPDMSLPPLPRPSLP